MASADQTNAGAHTNAKIQYLLHLADNALVLGQRNAEWCGHGPVLEEDIALANISLDLIGQARLLYQHVASLIGAPATEDTLAYFRDDHEFRNYTLLELPHSTRLDETKGEGERDYAVAIVRNFLYSALMVLLWEALQTSSDTQLAAIAGRSVKEVRYHLRHSRDWLVRLGDGTADSHARTQTALDHLMPYVLEFWAQSATESVAADDDVGVTGASLQGAWQALVEAACAQATLSINPPQPTTQLGIQLGIQLATQPALAASTPPQGKNGFHSPHLAPLLADMQSLARQHPGATW